MVHAVGAEPGPDHPHEDVVVLVAALGGGEGGEGAGAVGVPIRLSSCAARLNASSQVASRKALYQAGGVATRSRTSSSSPFRMPVSGGLPTLRWGGRGSRRVPISSIKLPGPSRPGPLAGPHPLLAVVHPALPDQRRHQPVPVHREVVPEPALHAGGALVGVTSSTLGEVTRMISSPFTCRSI